jgi:hypothetical protein
VLKTASTADGSPPADASLFAFLRHRYDNSQWLEYHYRSHEDIIGFAQQHVYDNRISVTDSCPRGFDEPEGKYDSRGAAVADGPPVTFVDVDGEQQWRREFSGSVNPTEVEVAADVVNALINSGTVAPDELGVITPYRGQRSLIADELTSHAEVEVSTVDGFQGREREVVVFSTVNTERGGLEFAGNRNRFNVAASRPERQFIILGNRSAIRENAPNGNLLYRYLVHARSQGGIFGWKNAEWDAGIPSGKITVTAPEYEERTAPDNTSKDDGGSDDAQPWVETDLDETAYNRIKDIVRQAPTTNGELAEVWGLIDGREAWEYLLMELPEYFERNENQKIQPTEKARDIVHQ